MSRDTRTKVTVYIPNLVVRTENKRTHLSSPLSDGIVQYREPIGTSAFFFFFNRTISAYTFVKSPMKRSIGVILQRRWSGNSCSTSSRHVSVHHYETNGMADTLRSFAFSRVRTLSRFIRGKKNVYGIDPRHIH